MFDQERAQWPADGAGKAADQRDVRDGTACSLAIKPAERGKRWVIKAAAHAQADDEPGGHQGRQGRGQPQAEEAGAQQAYARHQDGPAALPVDDDAHAGRHEAGHE